MYLTKFTIENIKCFGHAEFDFQHPNGEIKRWNVILGENGTGKSTLLQAIGMALMGTEPATRLGESTWVRGGVRKADQCGSRRGPGRGAGRRPGKANAARNARSSGHHRPPRSRRHQAQELERRRKSAGRFARLAATARGSATPSTWPEEARLSRSRRCTDDLDEAEAAGATGGWRERTTASR